MPVRRTEGRRRELCGAEDPFVPRAWCRECGLFPARLLRRSPIVSILWLRLRVLRGSRLNDQRLRDGRATLVVRIPSSKTVCQHQKTKNKHKKVSIDFV